MACSGRLSACQRPDVSRAPSATARYSREQPAGDEQCHRHQPARSRWPTPEIHSRIAIIANSVSGGGTPNLTLNFSDGPTFVTNYNAPDWFNNSGYALQGVERINLNSAALGGDTTNPRFYQTTIDPSALFGATNTALVGMTFTKACAADTTRSQCHSEHGDGAGAIGNEEVTLGQRLSFTASATDTDLPPQTFTFPLGTNSPDAANIGPTSGIFIWTPAAAPATNSVSVIVSDNGTPSLNATQTFLVTVYLPPTITIQVNGNQTQLAWPRGILREADNVTGPYTDLPEVSPFPVDFSASRKFYRIRM